MEIQRVIDVERETWIHACKEVNTHTKKERKRETERQRESERERKSERERDDIEGSAGR